jgi:spermidine synthase
LHRALLPFLSLLFFCSGACALVYQVMWLRMLALVFGVTVYAASTVLASFMGGLAIGSFAAGRIAGQLRHPLVAFGALEIGIGASALATPLLLDAVKTLWVAIHPSMPTSLWFLTVARFAASFAILIVPTTLMGATLPVVMRSALVRDTVVGSRVGVLYAVNTFGAIFGALLAGFYLVPEIGMSRSFQFAALVNVAIGLAAIGARRAFVVTAPPAAAPPAAPVSTGAAAVTANVEVPTRWQSRAVLWTFVLSGMMTLALEIVWFRMLVTHLRPTAYAFTIMLAAVLAGIALGSAAAAPLLRRQRAWLPVLTVVQVIIAIASVLSLNTLSYSQTALGWVTPALEAFGVDPYIGPIVAASMLAMLPTTLLLGFAFPMGLAVYARGAGDATRRIGVFYSMNVCGAIAGSVLGGFILLPALGARGSLVASAAMALVSSVLLAVSQWRVRPNFAGFVAIVGPVAFAMAALNAADPYASVKDAHERVRWRQEGVQTTVAIHESGERAIPNLVMYLDGMHQASDFPPMTFTHQRIGAFPVMLHPNPKDALVVGLGGGATAGAVAQFPEMSVDVVELSAAVVNGASFFKHINFDLLNRPNVQLRVDDGRNYLLTTRKKYDVITADIILPRHAGAGALYSREYFELVRNALKDDGLVLQWNGGEGPVYNLILRTFVTVFPYTTLWADGTLMLGSTRPFTLSRSMYERRHQEPSFRRILNWNYDRMIAAYLGGPPELARWVGEGPIITDDRPLIEYFLSLPNEPQLDRGALVARPADIVRP